ncbi:SDR family NAD(P)-dependent oxidoreductase [Microaerobacter geothermalis]|uniref:SDR family oxidoreductase n=1 Tax=Microaerobacter geothermalis TaxID=674972 RepID=UPI001F350351|nr:SDR family NAD(P)-dependent oxidoreductase [Microaerobacter geothermalis]MCF6094408.1 SDR family NAD(P)-dependent oxidoreductase [Microaerobacter geothermalis]
MGLENKVAIVTGASKGIGKAIAEALAKRAVDVVLVARNGEELKRVAADIESLGREAVPVVADVTVEEDVHRVVENTLTHFGKIDILVNNAGIGFFKSVKETSLEEWKRLIDTNLTGTFLFSKAVIGPMAERGQGYIVNISSDIGKWTIPNAAAYCASKYGIQGFSGALAKEVRKLGIRVGVINPGATDTYFNHSKPGVPEKENWLKPEDVADAVVYMVSAPRHAVVDEIMIHPIVQQY